MRALSSRLRDLLSHLAHHGIDLPFATAMVLTGGAFRHYFFTPEDNHAWLTEHPGQWWREDTLIVENYGLYESIEGHTGWASRRWPHLNGAQLVQLLRHEREEGRVLRQEADDEGRGGLITDFEVDRDGLRLEITRGAQKRTLAHHDISTLDDFIPTLGVLQSLRPEPRAISPQSRTALSSDTLRWATRHWRARKELIFDIEAFYAAGERAWETLATFAASPETTDDGAPQTAARQAYLRAHLREIAIARAAAVEFFSDDDAMNKHLGDHRLPSPVVANLTTAWNHTHEAIESALQTNGTVCVDAIKIARDHDEQAFQILASAVP